MVERVELRKKQLEVMARYNTLGKELSERYGEIEEDVFKKVDADFLKLFEERSKLEGVSDFLNDLLKEEEVNPKDYGIDVVHIG